MVVRLPASERREQLLHVALETFARQGYHGTSMNDVALAAGVTKPVLYQHFGSKRELYRSLLEAVGERLISSITAATADAPDGRIQTERGFGAYFGWVCRDPDAFRLLFGSGARRDDEFNDAVRRFTAEAAAVIAPLIAVDIDPEHQSTIAFGLVGLAEGVSRRLLDNGLAFDSDTVARQVSELAWAGLRGLGRAETTVVSTAAHERSTAPR
jgi:AcrR family transcriptional regulator